MRASRLKSTPFYEFFNANPKGRLCGDCAVRACALAAGVSWEQCVKEMTELGLQKAYLLNDERLFPEWLKSKGFVAHGEPRDADNKKMTVAEFLERYPEERDFVCLAGSHHVAAVKDGKVRDVWDSSRQTMHRWWSKPRE